MPTYSDNSLISKPLTTDIDNIDSLFDGATFFPGANASKTQKLLDEVWKRRQAMFLALGLKISVSSAHLYEETGFSIAIKTFLSLSTELRRQITEYPPFRIWLRKCIRVTSRSSVQTQSVDTLKTTLSELTRVLESFEGRKSETGILTIPDISVQVTRFTVDPLIAEVSPPTYQFPSAAKQKEIEKDTIYTLPFFVEVASLAIERIRKVWPAAYEDFDKFVKLIVHVTDGSFRSCSAERYSGVIFLSSDDRTLLELEESLIHEFGHQILYNVMELDPLVVNRGQIFKLPWSGSERDLYGYFHAFYIYILLVLYFEQIQDRSKKEQKKAERRMIGILKGLIKALPDFESNADFTSRGRELFLSLREEVQRLAHKHQTLIVGRTY